MPQEIANLQATVPTVKRTLVTWGVRVIIAALMVWLWLSWNGGPDWLWGAWVIYACVSLAGAFLLRAYQTRKMAQLTQMLARDDDQA